MQYILIIDEAYWLVQSDGSLKEISSQEYLNLKSTEQVKLIRPEQGKQVADAINAAEGNSQISQQDPTISLATFLAQLNRDGAQQLPESGFLTQALSNFLTDQPFFRGASSTPPPMPEDATILVDILENGDDYLNRFEVPVTDIVGQTQSLYNGQVIELVITDSAGKTLTFITSVKDNTYSLSSKDISSLAEGPATVVATAKDFYGNAISATDTTIIDTLANIDDEAWVDDPNLDVSPTMPDEIWTDADEAAATDDGRLNATQIQAVVFSGVTSEVESGRALNIEVVDEAGTSITASTTLNADGSYDFSALDLSSLDDGTLTVKTSSMDVAGNPAERIETFIKDTQASTTFVFDGEPPYSATEISSVSLSGVVNNIEPGQKVLVKVTDSSNASVVYDVVQVQADGTWQTAAKDLAQFDQGTLTAEVKVADVAGNLFTQTITTILDTEVNIDIDTDPSGLSISDIRTGTLTTIKGSTDAEVGQEVTVSFTNVLGQEQSFTTTVISGGGSPYANSFSVDVTVDGLARFYEWEMKASVADVAGNVAADSTPTIINPSIVILSEDALPDFPAGYSRDGAIRVHDYDSIVFSADQSSLETITSFGVNLVVTGQGTSTLIAKGQNGDTVLEAVLDQANGKVSVTLYKPVDQGGFFGADSVLADIFLDATQTSDADGTAETVVAAVPVVIREAEAFTFDDEYAAVEAKPFSGNVFSNDNLLEGPLDIIFVKFGGVEKTVSAIAPAIIDTGKGILTVYTDGVIEFNPARNLDNTVLQEINFSYGALDADKDYSSSNVNIKIADGEGGIFPSGEVNITEADFGDLAAQNVTFDILAGSDDLDPSSIRFSEKQLSLLADLEYKSSGVAISYELSVDSKTLIAKSGADIVFELSLSATLNADGSGSLVATAAMVQGLPIDHKDDLGTLVDTLVFPLNAIAFDNDGTPSEAASTLLVHDGNNIQLSSVASSVDEENIDTVTPSYPSDTQNLTVTIGSDKIVSVVFADAGDQPNITSGGVSLQYEISTGSGITQLVGYLNANGAGDPHFVVQINGSLDDDATNNLNYTFTLYKAIDQLDEFGNPLQTIDLDFSYIASDFDGDLTQSSIRVSVDDASGAVPAPGHIAMTLTETPKKLLNVLIHKSDSVDLSLTAGKDKVVAAEFNLVNGDEVLDSSGIDFVTQNGIPLVWFQLNDHTWIAKNSVGQDVLVFELPSHIDIGPGDMGNVPLTVTVKAPFDQGGISDDVTIPVSIIFKDSDLTETSLTAHVTIIDGRDPRIFASQIMLVNESDVLTGIGEDTATVFGVKGSDQITEVTIALNTALTTQGGTQTVSLAASVDANGWYVATDTAGDEVFRIRISTSGEAEFQLSKAIDHATQGVDVKTIAFDIVAVDFEGDTSNTKVLQVNVVDDTPDVKDSRTEVTEGTEKSFDVLSTPEQEGADTAVVTSITYNSVPTAVPLTGFVDIPLFEGGDQYGILKIFSDGRATVYTTDTDNKSFEDTVVFTVIDKDGDLQDGNLIIDVKDEEANINIQPLNAIEDTDLTVTLTADPGDLDDGEVIEFITFANAPLQNSQLFLDQGNGLIELSRNGDGNYFLSVAGGTLIVDDAATGEVIPNGTLVFRPALNISDPTHDVHFDTTVAVQTISSGLRETDVDFNVNITPVVDAPLWENSVFNYTQNEDASAANLQLDANLFDTDGSEVLTYRIENIDPSITLIYNNKIVSEGQILNESQFSTLTYSAPLNFSGKLTFDAVAISQETSTGDTAEVKQTITIDVAGVADTPKEQTSNVYSLEDELIPLSSFLDGQLLDADGSEELFFEFTVPAGWDIVDSSSQPSSHTNTGAIRVSDADVKAGNAFLKPKEDMSSASPGGEVFQILVKAIAVESAVDGVSPAVEEASSGTRIVEITLEGVNDDPEFDSGPDGAWNYTPGVAGSGELYAEGAEDTLIALNFGTGTQDDDGSEKFNFLLKNIPDGFELVDENGAYVYLKVSGEENGKPVYSVSADELANLYLKPVADFSGEITFDLVQTNTEPDGASTSYPQTVRIDVLPVVEDAVTLYDVVRGGEDTEVIFNIKPVYNDPDDPDIHRSDLGDIDGSESLTNIIVKSLPSGAAFLVDGKEIGFSGDLDLALVAADFSLSFEELLNDGHLTLRPPEDSGENFTIPVRFEITDASPTGDTDIKFTEGNIYADIWALVDDNAEDGITRIETPGTPLVSADGKPIDLTGMATFIEEDIDGSEKIDYISITLPDATGWFITHPNGAIHDGQGNWLIKNDGLTSDTAVDVAEILQGATIVADHIVNPAEDITIKVRVLDQRNSGADRDFDADIISATISVQFDVAGDMGSTAPVEQLEKDFPIDGQEYQDDDRDYGGTIPPVDISGHINQDVSGDADDIVTFRIDAADLPHGGWFSGTGLVAEYKDDGTTVKAWVFPKSALADIRLIGQDEDFSGDMTIPVHKVSTDPKGKTEVTVENLVFDIMPQVDDIDEDAATISMIEDIPSALTFDLQSLLGDRSTSADEGLETVLSITFSNLPAGASFTGPAGVLIDNADGTFTLNDPTRLAEVYFVPPKHKHGEMTADMLLQIQDLTTGSTLYSNEDIAIKTSKLTFEVIADTDIAPVFTEDYEGDEDGVIALSGMSVVDIDTDGSETLTLEIRGVPAGATLYYDNGGTLEQLSNDGSDGAGGFVWSLTQDQLSGVVMKPPRDFSGDIHLTLRSTSMELSTKEIVTADSSFLVEVHPIADGAIFTHDLEDISVLEGELINIEIGAEQQEQVNANETITLAVQIDTSSSDVTAYQNIVGIRLPDGTLVNFISLGSILTAVVTVDAATLSDFDLVVSDDAYGHLDVAVSVGSQDQAVVGGVLETDQSSTRSQEVISIDIEALPDAPILHQQAVNIEAAVDRINLGLSLELIEPQASGEVNEIYITGVPDTVDGIEGAKFDGTGWTARSDEFFDGTNWVSQADAIKSLVLTGADPDVTYGLTIEPRSTLGSQVDVGPQSSLIINTALTLSGDNTLTGDAGLSNLFIGGDGDDTMTGSAAIEDTYLYRPEDLGVLHNEAKDVINDFDVLGDHIDLSAITSLSTGAELESIINLVENLAGTTTTLELYDDSGADLLQTIELTGVTRTDLNGGTVPVSDAALLEYMLNGSHTIITG